jgi:hypothetical protein
MISSILITLSLLAGSLSGFALLFPEHAVRYGSH